MNSTKDMDIFINSIHSIEESKMVTFKFQLVPKKNDAENSSTAFFKNFKPNSQKRSYSDFSIDRFLIKDINHQIDSKQVDQIEDLIKKLKYSIENHQSVIDSSFKIIKSQIDSFHSAISDQLHESQSKLSNELVKISQMCAAHVNIQSSDWQNIIQFIKDHQIDSKTIDYYLKQSQTEQKSKIELKQFEANLEQKRGEFNSLIFMNKSIQFTPGFSSKYYQNSIQNGFVKCSRVMSNTQNDSAIIERLEEYFFAKTSAKSLSHISLRNINDDLSINRSIHYIHSDQLVLLINKNTDSSDFFIVNPFGHILNQMSIANCLCICTNHTSICVATKNGSQEFSLTIYSSNLKASKQRIIKSMPIASCYSDENVYILSNSMPNLQIYDKFLNNLKNMNMKFNHDLTNKTKFCILNEKIFFKENNSQIIVSTVYSGVVLKKVNVPFNFKDYKIINPDLIMFINKFTMIFYDLNKECVKYSVKLEKRRSADYESKNYLSFCVTDHGLVLTVEKNHINVY